MKKLLLLLITFHFSLLTSHADEGMWTLYNLPNAVYEQMKGYGYELPYEKLYQADDAIMKAVVNFSGYCSGVVVSPDGLVFTNHHCGFEAIRSHSTVEHDYMLNGFYAKSYAEELPNKDMFVTFNSIGFQIRYILTLIWHRLEVRTGRQEAASSISINPVEKEAVFLRVFL